MWGYDLTGGKLLSPDKYYDIMGYCDPTWVSDYTYRKLFQRIQQVNSDAYVIGAGPEQPWRMLLLDGHGGADILYGLADGSVMLLAR